MTEGTKLILESLVDKACFKQALYHQNLDHFATLKKVVQELSETIKAEMAPIDDHVKIAYKDKGKFECEMKFSGDVLIFSYHSNVFNFDNNHYVHKLPYVEEEPKRSYCGMFQIYNFLSDSLAFNRMNDIGYLIARIFINSEGHFFVEGKRQLGFLYKDFANMQINKDYMRAIVESAMLYAIDFDLLVPPYQNVKDLTVLEKIQQEGISSIKTGKRLGFRFQEDSDRMG